MSEPMVSHDNVGFYLLSQEVSKFLKVVQSGQGADEIFGGYHWYPPMLESTRCAGHVSRDTSSIATSTNITQVVADRYVHDNAAEKLVAEHFATAGATLPIDKALRIDALVMLVDDPVKRVDNHTMAASLEARVPFLDHEVVEFAATVPPELKIADGGKYILKEASRRVIPAEVIDRPKGYFPVPALKYLRGAVSGHGARRAEPLRRHGSGVCSTRRMSTTCWPTPSRTSRRCGDRNCGKSRCWNYGCRSICPRRNPKS